MEKMGPHLTLDLIGCQNNENLRSLDKVWELLNSLPEIIGMTKLTQPYAFPYRSVCNPVDFGITGFIVIAESHISIHVYENRNYVFFDVFSCKPFDRDFVADYVSKFFGAREVDCNVTFRGKGWKESARVITEPGTYETKPVD